MKVKKTFNKIRQFGFDSGTFEDGGSIKTICEELKHEVVSMSKAVTSDNKEAIANALGDCVIKLTHIAELANERLISKCPACDGLGGYYSEHKGDEPKWNDCDDCGGLTIETCITSALKKAQSKLA